MKSKKYPKLIEHFRKKGYKVSSDSDLRDLHLHVPLELYIQFMSTALGRFNRECGRASKAGAEALEAWIKVKQRADDREGHLSHND